MLKWRAAAIVLAVLLVVVVIGGGVVYRNAALNWVCDQCGFVQPEIGTNVGPGQGQIYFPIGKGTTRVEAVVVVSSFPRVHDVLEANSCLNQTIKGEVINVPAISASEGKAVATILTARGLVTVGVVRLF